MKAWLIMILIFHLELSSRDVAECSMSAVSVQDTAILSVVAEVVFLVTPPHAAVVSAAEHVRVLAELCHGEYRLVQTVV